MADHLERALWALDEARRELAEAEASGDYEAVLIWRRDVAERQAEASDVQFFGPYGDADEERW